MTTISICPSCGELRHVNDNTGLCHRCSYWRSRPDRLDHPILPPELIDVLDYAEAHPQWPEETQTPRQEQ